MKAEDSGVTLAHSEQEGLGLSPWFLSADTGGTYLNHLSQGGQLLIHKWHARSALFNIGPELQKLLSKDAWGGGGEAEASVVALLMKTIQLTVQARESFQTLLGSALLWC